MPASRLYFCPVVTNRVFRHEGVTRSLLIFALTAFFPTAALAGFSTDYEAEDATLSGPVVATLHAGFTGTGYADYGANLGEYIEWTVTVEDAGDYALTFRYALQTGSRPLDISVNGGAASVVSFPATGAFTTWRRTARLEVALEAGENTVRATAAANIGPNVDSLRVSTVPAAGDTQLLEAENATLVGPNVATTHAGFTGTGYIDFGATLGEYAEWSVEAPADGVYSLVFRYAVGEGDRPLLATINGSEDTVVQFPNTGAWTNWQETEALELELTEGMHAIRVTAETTAGGNIDSLTVALLCVSEPEGTPPSDILLETESLPEGVDGAVVGDVTVLDPDPDETHMLAVSDGRFEIVDGVLKLASGQSLDFDTEPDVVLEITATDKFGLTFTKSFTLAVIEAPPEPVAYEAEDAEFHHAKVRARVPGYSGRGYLTLFNPRKASVEWTIEVTEAGDYDLCFRYDTTFPFVKLNLFVDDELAAYRLPFPASEGIGEWQELSYRVTLGEGTHGIRLATGYIIGPRMDLLTVKPAGEN